MGGRKLETGQDRHTDLLTRLTLDVARLDTASQTSHSLLPASSCLCSGTEAEARCLTRSTSSSAPEHATNYVPTSFFVCLRQVAHCRPAGRKRLTASAATLVFVSAQARVKQIGGGQAAERLASTKICFCALVNNCLKQVCLGHNDIDFLPALCHRSPAASFRPAARQPKPCQSVLTIATQGSRF